MDKIDSYIRIREEKRKELKHTGKYTCVFCSLPLPLNDEGVDCHHIIGRDNNNLTEYRYLSFCHHKCHMEYHQSSVKPAWWDKFLTRIKREWPELTQIQSKWMK